MPEWAANAKPRPMLESTGNSLIAMLPDNPEGLLKQLRKPKRPSGEARRPGRRRSAAPAREPPAPPAAQLKHAG